MQRYYEYLLEESETSGQPLILDFTTDSPPPGYEWVEKLTEKQLEELEKFYTEQIEKMKKGPKAPPKPTPTGGMTMVSPSTPRPATPRSASYSEQYRIGPRPSIPTGYRPSLPTMPFGMAPTGTGQFTSAAASIMSGRHMPPVGAVGFFSPAPFLPMLGQPEPVDGVDVTHGQCLCEFMEEAKLGQGCATSTAGGSGGSAEFGPDSAGGGKGVNTILAVAAVGGVGVAALFALGVL